MRHRALKYSLAALLIVGSLTALALTARQAPQGPAVPGVVGTHTENGLAGFAKILCSGVFVSGRTPEDVAQGSAYFFMPRGRAGPGDVRRSIAAPGSLARRSARSRASALLRRSGLHHPESGEARDPFHARRRSRTALPDAQRRSPGRWAIKPDTSPLPATASTGARIDAALDAAFSDPAGADRRVPRRPQGTDRRRAVRAGHHEATRSSKAGRWGRAWRRRCSRCS